MLDTQATRSIGGLSVQSENRWVLGGSPSRPSDETACDDLVRSRRDQRESQFMTAGHSEDAEGLMPPHRQVRGATHVRKRLRRELRRVGADGVSLYIDGPRSMARLRFPGQDRSLELAPGEALELLRSLPNGAGAQATVDALARK